jgi:hypothetical protein
MGILYHCFGDLARAEGKIINYEALAKPMADATERVPPVQRKSFVVSFGGPRFVVAVIDGSFSRASYNYRVKMIVQHPTIRQ